MESNYWPQKSGDFSAHCEENNSAANVTNNPEQNPNTRIKNLGPTRLFQSVQYFFFSSEKLFTNERFHFLLNDAANPSKDTLAQPVGLQNGGHSQPPVLLLAPCSALSRSPARGTSTEGSNSKSLK